MLIVNRTEKFLTNLTCGCGRQATVGWHKPLETGEKRQKMSKISVEVLPPKKEPDPYGWACDAHIPPGIEVGS